MDIRALYTTKPPKCALTCQGDLVADRLLLADLLFFFIADGEAGWRVACGVFRVSFSFFFLTAEMKHSHEHPPFFLGLCLVEKA
jgi:hypothetical protein